MPEEKKKKPDKAAKEAAAKLAARQEAAENAFAEADADGSGSVDASELGGLLMKLLQREGIAFDKKFVEEFVTAEFAKADTDGSGDVDFDEFISYFNSLVDRLSAGAMNDALEQAKKATAKKLEDAAIAEDEGVYANLHTLVAMLSGPSVRKYSGLVVPFKLKDKTPENAPNPEHGASSHGLIIDVSRRAQRLLTPWGSLPIGYRLAFEGYQEKELPPAEDDAASKNKAKKAKVSLPVVPADPAADEKQPVFFVLARPPAKPPPGEAPQKRLLALRRIPQRCHYQVVAIKDVPLPVGEVVGVTTSEAQAKLGTRWQAVVKKFPKDPAPDLPADDADGGPLINLLLGSTVAVRADRLENLNKRKEVTQRTGNKKFEDGDKITAMLAESNDDAAAVKRLVKMQSSVNNVLDRRGGHATRAMVVYALDTCEYDVDHAEWMLKNQDKLLKRLVDKLYEQRGLATGIGYPRRQDLERMLVYKRADEGPVLAELKRLWRTDIEAMADILAASNVEEMLTNERCEAFAFAKPATADEAQHVEDLYLSDEFARDGERLIKFLSEAGSVLKREKALGSPTREDVEDLLRELEHDGEKVKAFLEAVEDLMRDAAKNGQPTRDDCKRYLRHCALNLESGRTLMKTIWTISNAKPPKPPGKGSKAQPKPHYAAMCGFPSRDEAEWALLGTRKASEVTKEPAYGLAIDKAVELLTRLDTLHQERAKHPNCGREDIAWALDPERDGRFIKVRPLSHEEYKAGETPSTIMLAAINSLVEELKAKKLTTSRAELLASLEKLSFDQEKAQKYLNGVGTLMQRQAELAIVSREEVEAAMNDHDLDDDKVIELFHDTSVLQKKKLDLGNPSRDEIKAYLTLAWEVEQRLDVTAKCLVYYRQLMNDDDMLMTLFGKTPEAEDVAYIRTSILRYKGDPVASLEYMKKVSEIESKGESLGYPSKQLIIETLDACNEDKREANKRIREDYHKRRDIELKAEYARKKDAAEKSKDAS